MIKVRTAKKGFSDTGGREVKPGEHFILVEVRPQFYSRRFLEDALAALDNESNKEPKAEEGESA